RLNLCLFADVGEYRDRSDTKISGLARDGLSLLLIGTRVDHDMRAFAGQLQHGRSTDIAPRSCNERDLPFELTHAPLLLQCLHRTRMRATRSCGSHQAYSGQAALAAAATR